ncbi:MAG: hypothetical protein SPG27_14280 [Butyricimonas virosa]|jgi:putative membrane protein|nr:hypothetical protein [Butyricimonas virosa]
MKALFFKIVPYVIMLVAILAWAFGYVIYGKTLIAWWEPLSMALILAIVTLFFTRSWKWLTHSDNKILNGVCHIFHASAFCYLMILGGNFMLADPSSTREEKVTVLSKHIETHKQTRRVGKHRYVPAGERKEYYLHVVFENGAQKKFPVSLSTYNKTRTNATRTLTLEKGFFGYTIIKKGI